MTAFCRGKCPWWVVPVFRLAWSRPADWYSEALVQAREREADLETELGRQQREVARLRELLRPWAALAANQTGPDWVPVVTTSVYGIDGPGHSLPTLGHCRRAAAALKEGDGNG